MSEWKDVKLGEICSYGKERIGVASLTSATYISTENMQPNRGGVVLASSIPDKGCVVAYKKDDVLISNIRPYFKKIWQASHDGGCSADVLVFRNRENVNAKFLYYSLSADSFFDYSMATAKGTKMPRGDKNSLMEYGVKLPPLAEQKRIAEILGSLDDKIELNNRINRNLEEQAHALFKNRFIDFEPFGGKMPEDWIVGKLSDLGTIVGGGTPSKAKKEYYTNHGIAWITPKDLSLHSNKFTSKGEIDITQEGYGNSSAKLMPKGSVLFSSRAPIGYISIAQNEVCTNQGFKSVVPKSNVGTPYIYFYLKTHTEEIENKASGSTFKEASGSLMNSLDAIIPPDEVLDAFNALCNPIFEQQENLEKENQRLTTLRDTLLSKLMRGEMAKGAAV